MSSRFRKGDSVLVISGNDRGKMGKVLFVKGEKVVIEGVNVRKKHLRKTQENQKGQIIEMEKPIHHSNVKICIEGAPVKLHVKSGKEGRELHYLDANKKPVLFRSVKKGKK